MESSLKLAEPAKRRELGKNPAAWRCFRRFEETRDDDLMAELEEMEDGEVKGEIIQNSLIAFADYMASNPIPQHNSTGKQNSWQRRVQAILGTSERDDQGSNVTLAGME
jgi:hypothetical protein